MFWVIPYNIACYACQLGDYDEAREWLIKAFELEDAKRLLKTALADTDLKPMHDEIKRIAEL